MTREVSERKRDLFEEMLAKKKASSEKAKATMIANKAKRKHQEQQLILNGSAFSPVCADTKEFLIDAMVSACRDIASCKPNLIPWFGAGGNKVLRRGMAFEVME